MKTVLEAIRQIHAEKKGKVVPDHATDREVRERTGLSQADLDEQAYELASYGFIKIGATLNGNWYKLVEDEEQ